MYKIVAAKKQSEEKDEKSTLKSGFVALRKKTINVRTPHGNVISQEEYLNPLSTLPYGLYQGHCEVMGIIEAWKMPSLMTSSLKGLIYAIKNISKYENLSTEYIKLIQEDPIVIWHLVPLLFMSDDIRLISQLPKLQGLTPWTTRELLENKKLFHFLTSHGAQYKHYLAYAYQAVNPVLLQRMLNVFGVDATTKHNGRETSCITAHLMSNYDEHAYTKIRMLLQAGADINERIDERFRNTILHYLIALENPSRTMELIDFMEHLSTCSSSSSHKKVIDIDYTLQDIQGKTALYLATALGLEAVVNKLLNVMKTKQRNIGLNIPDQYGRTPVMIAAALGRTTILKKLIDNGANVEVLDNSSPARDVTWYMNASREAVAEILRFLSANPERGYYLLDRSYLYSTQKDSWPMVLVDNEGNEHLLLLSRKEPHFSRLTLALSMAEGDRELYIHLTKQIAALMPTHGPRYTETIVDFCLNGQEMARSVIKDKLLELSSALDIFNRGSVPLYHAARSNRYKLFTVPDSKSECVIDISLEESQPYKPASILCPELLSLKEIEERYTLSEDMQEDILIPRTILGKK